MQKNGKKHKQITEEISKLNVKAEISGYLLWTKPGLICSQNQKRKLFTFKKPAILQMIVCRIYQHITFRSPNTCLSRTIEKYLKFNTLRLQLFYTARKQKTGKGKGYNHITEKADLICSLFAL